jgi:hypothetical protein
LESAAFRWRCGAATSQACRHAFADKRTEICDVRTMNASEFDLAKRSVFALGDLPINICDHSGLNPVKISSLARQMYANGAKILFVDSYRSPARTVRTGVRPSTVFRRPFATPVTN